MTKFRACIDLHSGKVKQIVGGTLSTEAADLRTNFVSQHAAGFYARLYKEHDLTGAHVIMLGPGNEDAALEALREWPNGLQVGGGINAQNAKRWVDAGADKVIVTSCLFPDARFSQQRVEEVFAAVDHDRSKLVIDLSCRRQGTRWIVAMNKWQTLTDTEVDEGTLHDSVIGSLLTNIGLIRKLEPYCSEFLIHAADNEGLQSGIDVDLVRCLGQWCSIPVTYAGGGKSLSDLNLVQQLSHGKVDLTIGSALDIFGGSSVTLEDCIVWNRTKSGNVPS